MVLTRLRAVPPEDMFPEERIRDQAKKEKNMKSSRGRSATKDDNTGKVQLHVHKGAEQKQEDKIFILLFLFRAFVHSFSTF